MYWCTVFNVHGTHEEAKAIANNLRKLPEFSDRLKDVGGRRGGRESVYVQQRVNRGTLCRPSSKYVTS
jgi:hypothetical protein